MPEKIRMSGFSLDRRDGVDPQLDSLRMEITGSTELLDYRLVGRELTPEATVVEVRGRRIGDGFFGLIAGPCAVESREQMLETARAVAAAGATALRGGAFKPRARLADESGAIVALMGKTVG
jgi:3-deoxy-D-arabino-heptulosonate 7-phosphate (DAHP) synthase